MKKGIKIAVIIIAAVLALALVGFAIILFSGNQITVARCIVTENGSLYMVYDERPVRISAGDDKDYQTGDKLLIVHASAFMESYPEQARTVFVMKIGSGAKEDIPQKAFDVLIETGNYSISDIGGVDGPTNVTVTPSDGEQSGNCRVWDRNHPDDSERYPHFSVTVPDLDDATIEYREDEKVYVDGEILFGGPGNGCESFYLADIDDDGHPELCFGSNLGSGLVHVSVAIYDYDTKEIVLTLSDRMHYDYYFFLRDGQLCVKETEYMKQEAVRTGVVIYDGSKITVSWDEEVNASPDRDKVLEDGLPVSSEMPKDTTLEFWVAEDVKDRDWSEHDEIYGWMGAREFLGSAYKKNADTDGSDQHPEHYVSYVITAWPDYADGGAFVTEIVITDPAVQVYGLTLSSTYEEFDAVFEQLGYTLSWSEGAIETRVASKDGITFRLTRAVENNPDVVAKLVISAEVTNREGIVF